MERFENFVLENPVSYITSKLGSLQTLGMRTEKFNEFTLFSHH